MFVHFKRQLFSIFFKYSLWMLLVHDATPDTSHVPIEICIILILSESYVRNSCCEICDVLFFEIPKNSFDHSIEAKISLL